MSKDYSLNNGWVMFVPEFDGNRDDDEPITVEIKPMTVREAKMIASRIIAERVKGYRNKVKTNQAEVSQEIFTKHVRNIRNLSVNGTPVTSAEQLLESNLIELVNEIEEAVNDVSILNGGDVKNYRSRSGGLRGAAGTAASVPMNRDASATVQDTSAGMTTALR